MIRFLRVLVLLAGSSLLASARPESLLDHLRSEIDSRLAVAQPGPALSMFYSADDAAAVYVRNPGVWTRDIDLTGIGVHSATNAGYGGSKQTGTLITPSDIVVANHFKFNVGDRCVFVDNHNVTYYATISAFQNVLSDLTVEHVTWIKKIPPTLKVMPILPPDFRRYAPDHQFTHFPVLCTNQNRRVFVQDSADVPDPFAHDTFLHGPSKEPGRAPFSFPVVVGDSGQPVMVVIRGTAVLLTCNTSMTSGVSCPDTFDAINRALAVMGSRWRATPADLRGFATY